MQLISFSISSTLGGYDEDGNKDTPQIRKRTRKKAKIHAGRQCSGKWTIVNLIQVNILF